MHQNASRTAHTDQSVSEVTGQRTRVIVIGGGTNDEHEVSLASAAAVRTALLSRYDVDSLTIGRDGIWQDEHAPLGTARADSVSAAIQRINAADVVFPAVHGAPGEDGALAALCDLIGARIVGSPLSAGALGMDKWITKLVAKDAGIRTARGRVVHSDALSDLVFERPVVVKPVAAGSSHGVMLATDEKTFAVSLLTAAAVAAANGGRILLEEPIHGREIDIAVMREADGSRWASPALEITTPGIFDTATKYDGTAIFRVPAELSRTEHTALRRAALRMYDALGCAGVARMDFFLTEDGLILNEVNTMPGLTARSQAPQMFAAAGVPYEEFVSRLVLAALA